MSPVKKVGLLVNRDSGNDFRFLDIASHTGCFCLFLVCISSVVSFRVDIIGSTIGIIFDK